MINIIIILLLLLSPFFVMDMTIKKNYFGLNLTIILTFSMLLIIKVGIMKEPAIFKRIDSLNGLIPESKPIMAIKKERRFEQEVVLKKFLNCKKDFEMLKFIETCKFNFSDSTVELQLTESDSNAIKKLINQKIKLAYVDFEIQNGSNKRCIQDIVHPSLKERRIQYLKYNTFNNLYKMFKYGCIDI